MKKMFTLLALLTCFLGVKAVEVVDAEIHFSDVTEVSLGWGAFVEGSTLDIQDGYLHYSSPGLPEGGNPWDTQFTLAALSGFSIQVGETYTLELKIKGSVEGNWQNIGFAGGNPYGNPHVTTDWNVVQMVYENAGSENSTPLFQCGNWAGEWWIEYIKITHEERPNQRPKEWIELLDNGDAEKPWGDLANVAFNDQENNYKICAWSKTNAGDPVPSPIEQVDGSNVFVVHGTACADPSAAASAWDNQFWIEAPRALKAGEMLKVHFRYKASEAANTNTQMHFQNPSDYKFYQCIGDVAFTTEWQVFDKEISWPEGGNAGNAWSIAFNLNPNNKNAVDFYFDDLSIQELKLDHGWFVAGSNEANGLAYDFDNAIEFEPDPEDEELVVATVGTVGKPDTWVDKVMISTVRGFDSSFKSGTIKIVNGTIANDPDVWPYWEESGNAVIKLPAAGVWKISIDITENRQINFIKLEGEEDKQPLEEIANPTVNIVKGQERVDLQDDKNNEGVITVREEADDPNGENVGGEGHTGQTWDNQFFIVANRELAKGERTILKFKYKSSVADAKTTTQCHGEPGAYKHWSAIGDVTFQPEEQVFDQTFTVPDEADGMKSIAFNMAEIKGACDYEIYDVIWMTEDHYETLIDTTGDNNFYIKEGAGTSPYVVSGISSVVNESKASNNAIYNLAGQRVSKEYKGIVIKNGAKYIAK